MIVDAAMPINTIQTSQGGDEFLTYNEQGYSTFRSTARYISSTDVVKGKQL